MRDVLPMDKNQKLLECLVAAGKLTEVQAQELKILALTRNISVEDHLLAQNLLQKHDILQAKAEMYKIPFISLVGRGVSPDILTFVPEPVARKYKVMPFDLDKQKKILSVAMADPLDLPLIEFLEEKSGYTISANFCDGAEITEKIDSEYAQSLSAEVNQALEGRPDSAIKTIEVDKISEIIKEAPIAKLVSTILEFSTKNRASDIHLEPQAIRTRVRYRIDGILSEKLALPRTVHDAVVSRIKILSGMKIDERRISQDGRFNFKFGKEEVDVRVSTLPTVHGEKVVMRLLKKTGGMPTLADLGFIGPSLKNMETAITRPHGIILVTGPTGSGKTTTLYSILSRLNSTTVNIVTIEDPVEYELAGVNQVQINPTAGLTFASGLRAFLRQDPNIILVGEIRDSETMALAIQAALTGHLVFSTLHTNNAATTIPRLLDLGAEPFLIVSVLNAIVAQRIVRKICTSCKEAYVPAATLLRDIHTVLGPLFPNDKPEMMLYRGKGCKECNQTGYLGRIGIYETLSVNDAITAAIAARKSAEDIEHLARANGMITLKQDGYLKALAGVTTVEEVLRVAEE